MKVGTLTLHLPFNYGNALQMLSFHRYLREQGYDADVSAMRELSVTPALQKLIVDSKAWLRNALEIGHA